MKNFILAMAVSSLFLGCATTTSITEARSIKPDPKESFAVYGAYKSEISGVISWHDEDRCQEKKLMKHIIDNNIAHNAVNILMDETCEGSNARPTCRCDYTAIGLTYRSISADEALTWSFVQGNSASSIPNQTYATTAQESEGPAEAKSSFPAHR